MRQWPGAWRIKRYVFALYIVGCEVWWGVGVVAAGAGSVELVQRHVQAYDNIHKYKKHDYI